MNWLKNNCIKNTIHVIGKNENWNELQDLKDIEKSKRANCVDIATMVHSICAKHRVEHKIVWIRFRYRNDIDSFGHLFVIWKMRSGKKYVFRFVSEDEENPKGEIVSCDSEDFEKIIRNEISFYKPKVDEIVKADTSPEYLLFDDNMTRAWDVFVSEKWKQKDALHQIDRMSSFVPYKIFDKKIIESSDFRELLNNMTLDVMVFH